MCLFSFYMPASSRSLPLTASIEFPAFSRFSCVMGGGKTVKIRQFGTETAVFGIVTAVGVGYGSGLKVRQSRAEITAF